MKTRQQLEEWMKTHPALIFPKSFGAETVAFPSMAGIYRRFTDDYSDNPPLQKAFAQAIVDAMGVQDISVYARACRTHPSFVRQHHLIAILRESYDRVIWSEEWDHTGIDISIAYRGLSIGIASAIDTPRSHSWEQVKQRRHPDDGNLHMLRLYARKGEYEVGPFWLHNPASVERQIKDFTASILRPSPGRTA